MPAVAGLAAVGTLMDEDEDTEEKQRRMEAKIAAENFGAVIGFAAGTALAMKATARANDGRYVGDPYFPAMNYTGERDRPIGSVSFA